nr:MAG TPA: NapC/NirT cytochrome c family, N-terminal region [Caudoviricetes sp.]DAW87817.1 MAG TPA: NapC/NirT cytochrome c family, N-terminal region [Caudoviricetes sp.]
MSSYNLLKNNLLPSDLIIAFTTAVSTTPPPSPPPIPNADGCILCHVPSLAYYSKSPSVI